MSKKKIGVTLEPELHGRVKARAAMMGIRTEDAYREALTGWLKDLEETGINPERMLTRETLSDEEMGYVSRLLLILRSNHADFISAIKHTIDGLAGVVGAGRKARKD